MTNRLYGELDDIKARLAIEDFGEDATLGSAHEAVCRGFDRICGQPFYRDSEVVDRTFTPVDSRCLDFSGVPKLAGIATATDLIVKLDTNDDGTFETTLTINTDFILRPTNAAADVEPYTEIYLTGTSHLFNSSAYGRDTVQVTAFWGWPEVPPDITEAALIQTVHLFKGGKDAQTGALFFAGGDAVGALRLSQLHPLARGLIEPYRRIAVG